jgi:hypothetical protein
VAAVIVIAVIAFLAVDAYVIYRVFSRRKTAGTHGSVAVPGETQVVLQAGKVRVTYEEAKSSSVVVNDNEFGVPAGLQVTITSPSGQPVELKGPGFKGMGESTSTGFGRSLALVGTFEAAESGAYTVSAQGQLPDAVEPKVLIGT